jgi:hypothetical protein
MGVCGACAGASDLYASFSYEIRKVGMNFVEENK